MTIKVYEESYRDDLIFMVLQAKDALGRKPTINPDGSVDYYNSLKLAMVEEGDVFVNKQEMFVQTSPFDTNDLKTIKKVTVKN